jgi:hypothetical protein
MAERVRLGDTSAAEIDLDEIRNWVTFVKLETLIEVPIFILSVKLAPSNFDPSHTTAKIQFEYVEPLIPGEEDEEDETVFEFSTEQRAIKAAVQKWLDEGFPFNEKSIGPVTVTAYGEANARGSYPLCIADVMEEIAEPAPVRKDLRTDATRQMLAGKSTVNTARSVAATPTINGNRGRTVNPRKSLR